jgi:acetylornithine deacetylase/succinyl-diaminopimelate desuccinylase-like protein
VGIQGGLAGAIVPAQATARFLMRLVPDQDPEECYRSLQQYLESHAGGAIRWKAEYIGGGRATLVDRRGPGVQALQCALQATWGVPALFQRMGGSILAVSQLEEEMGVTTVLGGFGLPDSNIHGPDERLHLPTWRRAIEAITRFFTEARWS